MGAGVTYYTITENTVFDSNIITEDHFGLNLVTIYDEEFVDPTDSLSSNVSALGATTLRFPGGSATENFFDMTRPNLAVSARDPSQTLTPMDAFFAEAGRIGVDVGLVIPTQQAFAQSAAQAMLAGTYGTRSDVTQTYLQDVSAFVAQAVSYANANGVTIKSFEIGNEFWGSGEMTAAEYGHVAGAVATLLSQELPALGAGDAAIIAQATSAVSQLYAPRNDTTAYIGEVDGALKAYSQGDINSEFGGMVPEGFQTVTVPGQGTPRTQLRDITDGINARSGAATAIDGLVQHYYQTSGLDGVDGDKSFKFDQFDRMAEWLDRPADAPELNYHITEWNTKSSGVENNRGLQNAQMIVEHFFELTTNDIDAAQIWPLSFDNAQGTSMVTLNGDDLAINGQMFRLMSESLQGLTPVLDWDVSGVIDVHGYGSDDRLVLFVSERSGADQSTLSLDVSQFLPGDAYFMTSTELWDGGAGGADATAAPVLSTVDGVMSTGAEVSFSLGAWAIRRIEISRSDESGNEINGRDGDDTIDGGNGADTLRGGDGADLINGGAADDFIFGDAGDDRLLGGAGDDAIVGGDGIDIAQFSGAIADFTVRYDVGFANGGALEIYSAAEGTDSLSGIETLQFADGTVEVDAIIQYLDHHYGPQATASSSSEAVGMADVAFAIDAKMEIGSHRFEQNGRDEWHSITFDEAIPDVSVVLGPASFEGNDSFTLRMRNVTETGFEFQLAEWFYQDGIHWELSVSWMAGTMGQHELADGTKVSFGKATSSDLAQHTVALEGFEEAPTVFAAVANDAPDLLLTDRVMDVHSDQFDFRLQTEEAKQASPADFGEAALYWSAFEFTDSSTIGHNGVSGVTSIYGDAGFTMDTDTALFADMQSFHAKDTATVRYKTDASGNVEMHLQEEQSYDKEHRHISEDVAWWAIAEGQYDLL